MENLYAEFLLWYHGFTTNETYEALLNENLWLGHFSYWSEQKMPIFKHSMILQDEEELFTNKISKIIELSIMECERVYPIFNAVMRQNIQPSDALYREAMVM